MHIGELVMKLLFEADTMKLNDFIKSVGELNMKSIMTSLGVGGLYETIHKVMGVTTEAAIGMNEYAIVTGESGQEMVKFGKYAEQMGASADDAQASLRGLKAAALAARISGDMTPFATIGVPSDKINDYMTVFGKLIEFYNKTDPKSDIWRYVTAQLHVPESMIPVLRSVKDAQELQKKIGEQHAMSPEQVKNVMKYHEVKTGLFQRFWDLLEDYGSSYVAPALTGTMEAYKNLLKPTQLNSGFDFISGPGGMLTGMIEDWRMLLGNYPSEPRTVNNTANVTINVQGVHDPEKTSQLVEMKFKRVWSDYFRHQPSPER
jgi:hypothetical protein